MTDRTVSVGIVGAGIWGSNHALALTTHPRARLAMICDRDPDRARRAGERFGCAWTTDIEELAAEEARRQDPDGLDPALTMAAAVTTYLAFRRDELHADDERLLRLAARSEFDGQPPPEVADWLNARGAAV